MNKLLTRLALLFFSTLFAFLLAEVLARLTLTPPQTVITEVQLNTSAATSNDVGEKEQYTISEHPEQGQVYQQTETGRRLRANRSVTIENHSLSGKRINIQTNSLGYRNPDIGPKKGKRILFLGDSTTFADYLHEEETFVRLVEEKARQDSRNWETINAAVGSISLANELAILLETGLSLQPDVVVLGFYLNDFHESQGVHIVRLPGWMEKSWLLYHANRALALARGQSGGEQLDLNNQNIVKLQLQEWKEEFESRSTFSDGLFMENEGAFNRMIVENFSDWGASWSHGAWDYMRPLFEKLKNLSEEHNFQLVIVAFPIYQQVYTEKLHDFPQQQLGKTARELDIPLLDTLPLFREEALALGGRKIYESEIYQWNLIHEELFYDQCHHTPHGSQLLASMIYQFLSEHVED